MKRPLAGTSRRQVAALVVAILVTSTGAAAAVTVLVKNPDPIQPVEGHLMNAGDLTVDSQSLTYSGTDVTGLEVVVNNTGGNSHDVVLHFALRDSSGTLVDSTKQSKTISATSTRTVTWSFGPYSVSSFSKVEVTIEQTD